MCGYLVAGGAARLQPLGVVPPAEDLAVLVEVDEVHQQFAAGAADEAGRVPAHAVTRPRCKHGDVAAVYLAPALENQSGNRIIVNFFFPFEGHFSLIKTLVALFWCYL